MIGVNRRRVMGGGGGTPLHYDAEVEYLRGTGTQYIDTGIECTSDLSVKIKFRCSTSDNSALAGGIYNNGSNVYFRHHLSPASNNAFYWLRNGSATTASLTYGWSVNSWIEFELDTTNKTYYINGTTGTIDWSSTGLTTWASYGLFGRLSGNMATQIRSGNNDIAMCQLLRNGVLLRDFIPVRIGTTGYMYDKVSGTLFSNAGTGNFILGADKN